MWTGVLRQLNDRLVAQQAGAFAAGGSRMSRYQRLLVFALVAVALFPFLVAINIAPASVPSTFPPWLRIVPVVTLLPLGILLLARRNAAQPTEHELAREAAYLTADLLPAALVAASVPPELHVRVAVVAVAGATPLMRTPMAQAQIVLVFAPTAIELAAVQARLPAAARSVTLLLPRTAVVDCPWSAQSAAAASCCRSWRCCRRPAHQQLQLDARRDFYVVDLAAAAEGEGEESDAFVAHGATRCGHPPLLRFNGRYSAKLERVCSAETFAAVLAAANDRLRQAQDREYARLACCRRVFLAPQWVAARLCLWASMLPLAVAVSMAIGDSDGREHFARFPFVVAMVSGVMGLYVLERVTRLRWRQRIAADMVPAVTALHDAHRLGEALHLELFVMPGNQHDAALRFVVAPAATAVVPRAAVP